MEDDPDEDEMDDINIDDKRERHWRMVFKDTYGGVDDAKAFLHANRWDICVNDKEKIFKGGYLVEVVGHDKKKVLWEVVNDHVVENPTDHEEIGPYVGALRTRLVLRHLGLVRRNIFLKF